MEFKEVLGRRRSIRFYLPHRPVEREKVLKMLEAARRASCVGNVNSARGIVIWKDQASAELIKAITPPLGYQQMQTAPGFIPWDHDPPAYMALGLAVCQAMLIAYDEGLGVCPMSGPRLEQVAKLLKLPDTAVPVCLMAGGA